MAGNQPRDLNNPYPYEINLCSRIENSYCTVLVQYCTVLYVDTLGVLLVS
jgi:hypothetical protein